MADNELIAEWLGYEISHPVMGGVVQSMMGKLPKMREWVPDYDKHITFWHGKNGLLAEIEKRSKLVSFIWDLTSILNRSFNSNRFGTPMLSIAGVVAIRCAEPAQLAAALVKMIKEGNDEND